VAWLVAKLSPARVRRSTRYPAGHHDQSWWAARTGPLPTSSSFEKAKRWKRAILHLCANSRGWPDKLTSAPMTSRPCPNPRCLATSALTTTTIGWSASSSSSSSSANSNGKSSKKRQCRAGRGARSGGGRSSPAAEEEQGQGLPPASIFVQTRSRSRMLLRAAEGNANADQPSVPPARSSTSPRAPTKLKLAGGNGKRG
ncbi:unnamed protein product, partial [Ectocarpus fasciculatus]